MKTSELIAMLPKGTRITRVWTMPRGKMEERFIVRGLKAGAIILDYEGEATGNYSTIIIDSSSQTFERTRKGFMIKLDYVPFIEYEIEQ